ncbi:MAG: histone [Burkholderiales bacterium PBB4]|nr:MAG: histone [Burkholderiales bacterium PBB4]
MAKKLQDIQKQIGKLQLEAAALLAKGRREAISKINALLKDFPLTAADLTFGAAAPGKRSRAAGKPQGSAASKRANAGAPRYQDPATGKTWTGRGKPPTWIQDAADRNAFLIASAGLPSAPEVTVSTESAAKPLVKRRAAPNTEAKAVAKKAPAGKQAALKAVAPAKKVVAKKVAAQRARAAKKTAQTEAAAATA